MVGAKLVSKKLLGVVAANSEVQFMYDCSDVADILASITIVTWMLRVEAGLRALAKLTLPLVVDALANRLLNLMISEMFPLLAGTLNMH